MNAVEIEEAISALAEQPFDPKVFAFAFLEAFGNKPTTIKRLQSGSSNSSDIEGGVLQRNNVHIAVCESGSVGATLDALRGSRATAKGKVKFILATDGVVLEAEDLAVGDTVACQYSDFPNHFGFFLPLAGITTVKQIRNNPIDIQATSRLNRLYVELLKTNEDWASDVRRHDMNHFMARLIFCFFAEDTDIFGGENLFTSTVERMSDSRSENTGEVICELFRAMDTKIEDRSAVKLPRWADAFPYVNGGLFVGIKETPKFSRIARSYLLHAGNLNWQEINPDIFGSMIQAVADDAERGELGMHYTSVPNIERVLNPLFLDDLRGQLDQAGDNPRKLLNLRKRLANIRVFDPACGSGNFLVIAYIRMREIESEIQKRRSETNDRSWILLENFYGIELKDFAAEVARLSLLISEFQCDVRFIGQKEAMALMLPLRKTGQIHQGNALELDWFDVCPWSGDPTIAGPEIYICGNPPYKGRNRQGTDQKAEIALVFSKYNGSFASLDYVAAWIIKAAVYNRSTGGAVGLVATNSVCQGEQVALLWPKVFEENQEIIFAYQSFKWSNLAAAKAGVTVVILGLGASSKAREKKLYTENELRYVDKIGPYLAPGHDVVVAKSNSPISCVAPMFLGNMAKDGGNLIMSRGDAKQLIEQGGLPAELVRDFYGSEEMIHSKPRSCIWITDENIAEAKSSPVVKVILKKVQDFRESSKAPSTRRHSTTPHKFVQISAADGNRLIVIPRVSSVNRPFLPVDYLRAGPIIGDKCYAIYDAPLWNLALVASKLHLIWIGSVCSRLRTDFSYGNKLGWNTFPVPNLTEQNKTDLNECANGILLAREAHFPSTIADLYDPKSMPDNLCEAHERNDEVLERIYIGRRFKNDTERLEKLFELYTKMTARKAIAS